MSERREIPIGAAELVLARKKAGMKDPSITIGDNAQILPGSSRVSTQGETGENTYKVIIRKTGRAGPQEASKRAKSLKACKGLKGCEFAKCAENAFGKLPKNLKGLCSSDVSHFPMLGTDVEQ